ncbi:MAG: hypothetical protein BWY83_00001 [bacterium ADurb.Bin478]|nr:MAG: hypothetical protein BWY83_00001 [bacterium ADurb.Bin478]
MVSQTSCISRSRSGRPKRAFQYWVSGPWGRRNTSRVIPCFPRRSCKSRKTSRDTTPQPFGGMSFAPVIFTHSTPTWLRNWMNSSDWSCRSSQSFMPELPSKMSAISARTPGARGIETNAQLRQPWGVSAVQDTGPHGGRAMSRGPTVSFAPCAGPCAPGATACGRRAHPAPERRTSRT